MAKANALPGRFDGKLPDCPAARRPGQRLRKRDRFRPETEVFQSNGNGRDSGQQSRMNCTNSGLSSNWARTSALSRSRAKK